MCLTNSEFDDRCAGPHSDGAKLTVPSALRNPVGRVQVGLAERLPQAAERKWWKLNGYQLLGDVIRGVQFKDGTKVAA